MGLKILDMCMEYIYLFKKIDILIKRTRDTLELII